MSSIYKVDVSFRKVFRPIVDYKLLKTRPLNKFNSQNVDNFGPIYVTIGEYLKSFYFPQNIFLLFYDQPNDISNYNGSLLEKDRETMGKVIHPIIHLRKKCFMMYFAKPHPEYLATCLKKG